MISRDALYETGYPWEFLRAWALDFIIEYMTVGRSSARRMCAQIDEEVLNAGDWDARDAVQLLTAVIAEVPDAVLDFEHERKYFGECGRAFAQEGEPKRVVRECSRILWRMEEVAERAAPTRLPGVKGRGYPPTIAPVG
jgi:hypothetical protein